MLPVLEFVFQSFWTWLGSLLLLGSIGMSIGIGVQAFKEDIKEKSK